LGGAAGCGIANLEQRRAASDRLDRSRHHATDQDLDVRHRGRDGINGRHRCGPDDRRAAHGEVVVGVRDARQRRAPAHQAVGFWQRSSGAKAGVGANFVSVLEYQLPEAAPARVRSASFQFSGRPSQCVGAEPVVIDVYAYAADGKADVNDAKAGSRVTQLSADCTDKAAFSRPIDVTAIVRQQAVASGVRFVGFNIRKANNRQGPGLFDLSAGKLTVVLADQAMAAPAPAAKGPQAAPAPGVRTATASAAEPKLSKKEVQRKERRAYVQSER
jgi:hypothetical protein